MVMYKETKQQEGQGEEKHKLLFRDLMSRREDKDSC